MARTNQGGLHGGLIARRRVTVDEKREDAWFEVGGLNAEAIFALFQRRRAELSGLFDRLVVQGDGAAALNLAQFRSIANTLLEQSPAIAGEIIAAGSGKADAETIAIARALPVGAQLAALEAIAELTFTSDMPPKKVLEIVARAMGRIAIGITDAARPMAEAKIPPA
jgi:hypothetical protein